MKQTLAALTLAALVLAPAAQAEGFADAPTLQSLSGTYVSPKPEPWYGGFGTREFIFHDGQWQLIFTHALDPAMTQRTFQFRTGGAYEVTAPSATVPGAQEATFNEDWKRVTLLTTVPEVIEGMGLAACNLTPNLEADISGGCGHWPSVAACGKDHDLLAMDANGLYFGQRPADNDMCSPERRPTALLTPVVSR